MSVLQGGPARAGEGLLRRFPEVGPLMGEAYEDLRHAEDSDGLALIHHLGPVEDLPRPWDVTTCTQPGLRREVWGWLDAVVDWLNTEYVWAGEDHVPGCWPLHPHLVHELGVVADQRRRATVAMTSEPLEEWQRYCLPAFLDRARNRIRGGCETGHTGPPGGGRIARYRSDGERSRRDGWYAADVSAAAVPLRRTEPRLVVAGGLIIDPLTGEVQQ